MNTFVAAVVSFLFLLGTFSSAQANEQDDLDRRAMERRAIEAVIWGMPAVNYDLMYQALVRSKGGYNQIVYWSGLPDWKNQTLTPNPDSIYLMPFIDTKEAGPVVLEISYSGSQSATPRRPHHSDSSRQSKQPLDR